MIKKISIREDSGSFDELLHIDCVITDKLVMRSWKAKSKRKFLYLLDNREYTNMRNSDVTSLLVVPTLYKYVDSVCFNSKFIFNLKLLLCLHNN